MRRHANRCYFQQALRDQLADCTRQGGATVQIEQRTSIQIRNDLQLGTGRGPAPRQQISTCWTQQCETSGLMPKWLVCHQLLWLLRFLRLSGAQNRRKTKHMDAHPLLPRTYVDDGVRPFVIEQHGRLGEAAIGFLMLLVANNARANALVGQVPIAQAQWQAMREIRGYLSCTLLRCTWVASMECCGGAINTPCMSLPGQGLL